MILIRIIPVLFSALLFHATLSQPAFSADYAAAWFTPELAINKSPLCEQVEKHTIDVWHGKSRDTYPATSFNKEASSDTTVVIDGEDVHISTYRHIGCGGACNQYQIIASSDPLPGIEKNRSAYTALLKNSPPKGYFNFLSSQSGEYFIYTKNDNKNNLFKLNSNASWDKVCSITTSPSKEQIARTDGDYELIQASLESLRTLVGGLRQSAGFNCGSMRTHARWTQRIDQEFSNLLYNPRREPKNKQAPDATVDINTKNLTLWSLQGLGEHNVFTEFQTKLPIVTRDLSQFYQKHFGWSRSEANHIAEYALTFAINSGISFYSYKPFNTQEEVELRKAILEKRSIADIKAIDISAIPKVLAKRNRFAANESILNIAVTHPEALTYLIESGFDVNNKNAFHKTPLMYAAQHNAYDAVKILIDNGADVNAGTIIPEDRCKYTLKTTNITPLHYAVRYAHRDIIDLLLANGASKFYYVENQMERPSQIEYPVDWLTRFDNALLTAQDKAHLEAHLKLPPHDELYAIANKLNLQGEKLYADKSFQEASIKFKEASYVDTNNIRALNNYALASLKLDNNANSLAASANVIRSKTATDKQKASAHFNTGLACEGASRYGIRFNGKNYCRKGPLDHYISAYKGYPTTSRANTIVERITTKKEKHAHQCVMQDGRFEAVIKIDNRKLQFLHKKPMAELLDNAYTLKVLRKPFRLDKQPRVLKRKDMLELQNGYTISTYGSNKNIYDEFSLDEGVCSTSNSTFIDENTHVNMMDKKFNKQ